MLQACTDWRACAALLEEQPERRWGWQALTLTSGCGGAVGQAVCQTLPSHGGDHPACLCPVSLGGRRRGEMGREDESQLLASPHLAWHPV
ncbi:hypothetical protein HaLaN_10783, partial [Haematococcus lacustris]